MFLKRDTRPVWRQVVSGFKKGAVLIAVLVGITWASRFIPVTRIGAFVWHLRHGMWIDVGSYRFPAPKRWYVQQDSAAGVMLVDMKTGDVIQVSTGRPLLVPLSMWAERVARPVVGIPTRTVGRRELQVGDESVLCIERDWDAGKLQLFSINCRFERGFEVEFTPHISGEADKEQFYSMLAQTRKL